MYGLNIDPLNLKGNPTIAELRSLGVQAVRYSYKDFSSGSQPDPQQLQFYTNHLRQQTQAGLSPLLILTYQTFPDAPSHPVSDQVWDTYIANFARRAGQLAQLLISFRPTFQIWNEPDLPPHPEYIRTMPEAVYGRMLRRSYDAIKAAAPQSRVITAGLGSGNPTWLANVIRSQNGLLPAEAIAIHPYGQRPEPSWPGPTWGFGYVGDLIRNYQRVTRLPLIISEIGVEHVTPQQQADYLRRFYQTITTQFSAGVERVYWFCYSDGMVSPYGLRDLNNQPKPAYQVYQAIATAQPPSQLADTVVTAVTFDKNPIITGDLVTFEATVRNIGSAVTGSTVGVAFLVDGVMVTFGSSPPLEAGTSRLIRAVAPWTATLGEHTLTAVVDDVNRYPEISESNNSLTLKIQVQPKPVPDRADTVVQDIAFERLTTGQVRLAALVANIGQSDTADQVGLAFFVDDRYTTFGLLPPLKAGEAKALRAQQTISLTGLHKITAVVDDINRYPEANEQNNTLIKQIDFGTPPPPALADVLIQSLSLGQGPFFEGDLLTFEAVVKNIGGALTGDVVGVAFLVNGQQITFGTAAAIPAGETRTIRAVTAWQAVAGRHRLTALADDVNRFPELSESNNQLSFDIEVQRRDQPGLPDSTLDAIGFERDAAGQIILNATVSNVGPVATPDVVGVAFFVNGQYATFGITAPMAAGTTQVIRATKALPLTGRQAVTAIVDDINRYNELSTQNNALTREVVF
jgi:subtilase family serine protease